MAMVFLVCSASLGCSGSKAPPTEPSAETPQAAATTSAAPEATPVAPGPAPTGRVVSISESNESEKYLHVEISFENQGGTACKIVGYTLTWPGGKKDIELEKFSVPPKDAKTRSARVHPSDGQLETLKTDASTVSVKSDCGTP